MRHLFLWAIAIPILSCNKPSRTRIFREYEVIRTGSDCELVSFYPVIESESLSKKRDSLNIFLKSVNEMDLYENHCDQYFDSSMRGRKKQIKGECQITFQTKSLICFEYTIQGLSRTIYRSVFVDLNKWILVDPESLFPNLDRGKLYPHVKRFVDSTGIDINLLAYQSGSKYDIMYGCTKNDLILYLGGEGEFEAYYKILIPLKEIGGSVINKYN